jgi:DNA-binding response OmpR family regulator
MPFTDTSDGDEHNKIVIASVIPKPEDLRSLRAILSHSNWTLVNTDTIEQTVQLVEREVRPVVLCEQDLPDGNWKDLLEALRATEYPPHLLVTCRLADDRLWAEVLNFGGYDVLPQPFVSTEVFHVLGQAWRSWHAQMRATRGRPVSISGLPNIRA